MKKTATAKNNQSRRHSTLLLFVVVFGFAMFTFLLSTAQPGLQFYNGFAFSPFKLTRPPAPLAQILGFHYVTPYDIEATSLGGIAVYSLSFNTTHIKENYDLLKTGFDPVMGFSLDASAYDRGNFFLAFSRPHERLQIVAAADGSSNSGTVTVALHRFVQ